MTHDELIAYIDDSTDGLKHEHLFEKLLTNTKALRAVVELHKPTDRYFPNRVWGSDGEIDIGGVTRAVCKCGSSSYPCLTIQAIEKELNNGI